MASTAAWSACSLSPRPTQRAAASAAASVTRTSSSARFRSGLVVSRTSCEMTLLSSAPIGPEPRRYGSDGAGGLALSSLAGLRAQEAGGGDRDRAQKRDPIAVVEA